MLKLAQLAIGGCFVLGACTVPVAPTADVMAVELTGLRLTTQRLALTLCVSNPNADALVFRQVTVNLDVANSPFATGLSDAEVRLAPRSSTRVPLTVMTTVVNLPGQLAGIVATGGVDYRVHGSVALDGAIGLRIPYSHAGRLDLVGALELASSAGEGAPSRCAASDIAVPL